jgi:EAL domain-containing protein (putative c-di-GMP-specific phosphodiesterase class I)
MEHESHPVALASFVMDDTRLGGSASVALAMALDVSAGLHAIIDPELRTADRRAHIQHVLDNAAFATWYQPIVRLSDRAVVGFEALTRFDDESQPDLTFAEATAVGFGVDLQLAAVRSAVAGSRDLPPGWLSINVSAGALTERIDELRLLFRNLESRPVVIELTEHEAVGDYRLVLAALASLGPTVQVAVDDAGAGYAGLTHILSLQPQMVKLDRTVISGIDSDSARQAIVAGLHHFANETGCLLIAEGVERAEEARQLTALGVDLGQGFLFGRPAPIVRDDNAAA